jgi:colanic acid biosynthesis glycosyl transferase WcaI
VRVLFLTVYFPPETGAPQARTYETARRFVEWGHEVTVLTAFPNHPAGVISPEFRGRLYAREEMDGMEVRRTWVYAAPNRGLWRWAAKHLSFAATAAVAAPFAGRFDVVVVNSSALFLGLTAFSIGLLRRVPWVLTVTDLWPATAVAQGQVSKGPLVRLTQGLANFVYARADAIVGVTRGICEALVEGGVPESKVTYIPNGTDTELFTPDADGAPVRRALGLDDRFVAMYAGTHGPAQGLDVVLDAAKLLGDEPDVRFVLVGSGVEKPRLMERARAEGIENVVFAEPVTRAEVPAMLNAGDVVLVTLTKQPLFEGALPSKTSEALACGRPVVMTVAGEAAELLEGAGAGIAVEPEEPEALAEAILRLKRDPALAQEMGRNGRAFAVDQLERTKLARRLEEVLFELLGEEGRTPAGAATVP